MTTIAANKHMMAADSLCDDGGLASKGVKLFEVDGDILGIAGTLGQGMKFVNWYKNKEGEHPDLDETTVLILHKDGSLETWDGSGVGIPVLEKFYAIGSGSQFAIMAMHLGKTPEEAVKLTCKFDTGSGLPVKSISRVKRR